MCKTPYEQLKDLADVVLDMDKDLHQSQMKVTKLEAEIEKLKEKNQALRKRMMESGVRLN